MASPTKSGVLEKLIQKKSLTIELLSWECDDKLFQELSSQIQLHSISTLAVGLGLTGADDHEEPDEDNGRDKILTLLSKWRENNINNASYLALVEVFIQNEELELAELVTDYVSTNILQQKSGRDKKRKNKSTQNVEAKVSSACNDKCDEGYQQSANSKRKSRKSSKTRSWYLEKLQPNSHYSNVFDEYYDKIVAAIGKDKDLSDRFFKSLNDTLLLTGTERKQADQLSCLAIKTRAIIGAFSICINRSRDPKKKFNCLLKTLATFQELKLLAEEMSEKVGVDIIVEEAQTMQCATKTMPINSTDLQVALLTESIQTYAHHLRCIYKKLCTNTKLFLCPDFFVDLAIVENDMKETSRATIHCCVDDILRKKTPISLEGLCQLPLGSSILIEGAPGIGKSMLAFELRRRWVNRRLLQQFSLLLFLRLGDSLVQSALSSAEDLLGYYLDSQSWKQQAIQDIIDKNGEGVLIILEGGSQFTDELVNNADKIRQCLPLSTFIVITRSLTKYRQQNFYYFFTHHFEVQGFREDKRSQYIHNFFKGNEALYQEFLKCITCFSEVNELLYVPINLAILLHVFKSSFVDGSISCLPETITELYDTLVQILIYQYLRDSSHTMDISFKSLKDLPQSALFAYNNLCKLAYDGICNKQQFVFCLPKNFETLGLMQKESQVVPSEGGDTFAYSFLHLTIQEFLAAYHIHENPDEVQHYLSDIFTTTSSEFIKMIHFLAGLTKLKSVNLSVPDVIRSSTSFRHIFESRNDSHTSDLFSKKCKVKVSRIMPIPIPLDMYMIGRCIALGQCQWELGFTLRGVTCDHLEMFTAGLKSIGEVKGQIEHITLSLNPLCNKGMKSLLKLPKCTVENLHSLFLRGIEVNVHCLDDLVFKMLDFTNLKMLLFHDNDFKEGEQKHFIEVLCCSKSLQHVSFSTLCPDECVTLLTSSHTLHTIELYQLSPLSVGAVLGHLSKSTNLKNLQIHQSEVKTEFVRSLLTSLPSSHIKSLEFINCAIDSVTVRIIADAVMNTPSLEKLNLSDNLIDDEGGHYLADMIHAIVNQSSKHQYHEVHLDHNPFTETTISRLLYELSSCHPRSIVIKLRLSVGWQDYVQSLLVRYPKVDKLVLFGKTKL